VLVNTHVGADGTTVVGDVLQFLCN
jgi:hypothetical protein